MSGKNEKKFRKIIKKKFRFDYEKLLKELEDEPLKNRLKFIGGLIKRLLFKRRKKNEPKNS